MRVAKVERFGGPEVLMAAEIPDPVAGPGQVVVRVTAADVLFVETVVRRGEGGGYFPVKPPYVPGGAVAGQVISVAKGVEPSWIGQRVVAGMAGGGYAQQAIALVADLVPIPDGLGMDEAVALFHDGRTALGLLEATGAHAGESVLVTAAAGGLGILLVQRARSSGAHVVAAARGQAKLRLVRELGAETVVDYSEPDWTTRVREATGSAVEHLLEILPAWFAIPEANAKYVESAERLPGLIARSGDRTIGVLLYRRHFQAAAEIHLMAVDPAVAPTRCRRRELLVTTEMALQEDGCCLLQVKTLGVSHPDQGYAATRAFYSSVGFSPHEETHELWPGSPCLIMVKPLPSAG